MAVKLLQLNCQGSYGVWDDLAREVETGRVDVAVIQEPPGVRGGLVSRLPGMVPVVPVGHRSRVGVHVRADLEVQRLDTSPSDWYVFAVVRVEGHDFVIGSLYLAPSEGVSEKLDLLRDVVHSCRADKVLICADENTRSRGWHSRTTEERGRIVSAFLERMDLHVVNRPGPLTTYCNVLGRGDNIDVTACNLNPVPWLREWQVKDWYISDHRAMTMTLDPRLRLARRRPPLGGPGLRGDLASRLVRLREKASLEGTVDERVEALTSLIVSAAGREAGVSEAGRG